MPSNSLVRSVLICLCLSLLLGWGCASSPSSRFYTLSPMADPPKPDAGRPISAGLSLALGPFRIPDYLDRPGIVTRPGNGNTIEIADYDLWAGSLKEAFASTLAQNLSILLDTNKILVYPYIGVLKTDYRIPLVIDRFEGTLGGELFLNARWIILEGNLEGPDRKGGLVQRSEIVEPLAGSDYAALVAAHSRALERLSREMARAIQSLPAPAAAK
jgi:uncharacterized protein